MALSNTKTYPVYNYNSSPVAVQTKYESFLIEGGKPDAPGMMPLTLDELSVVNSSSSVFKVGLLWFDPADAQELYTALRITGWKSILSDREIEDILLHPSLEGLQRILDIQSDAYFERVRGIFVGLKNGGADISTRVQDLIMARYRELQKRQRSTSIRLTPRVSTKEEAVPSRQEVDDMKAKLAEMEALMKLAQKNGEPQTEDGASGAKTSSGARRASGAVRTAKEIKDV